MKRRLSILWIAALLSAESAYAGSYGTELPFVAGTGARASGMGLAGTSLTGTSSSQYYNPAALALQEYRQLEAYRTTLFDSKASYLAASYAHPTLDFGTLGVSFLRVGVGGIEGRDESNTLLSSDLTSSTTRVLLGYAAGVTPSLALGINLKIDHQQLTGASGTGVGVDLAALVTHAFDGDGFLRRARAGVMLENVVEPSVKLDAEDVADPMRISAGASFDARVGRIGITAAADVVSPRYSPLGFRAGLEVDYDGVVALRVGADDNTPTFGIGVSGLGVRVDYAYLDEELGANHRFSVAIALGASKTERNRARQERLDTDLHERLNRRVREFEDSQLARLVARADSLFGSGDFAAANEQYGSVLAWNPSDVRAAAQQNECRFQLEVAQGKERAASGDYATALYHFRRANDHNPGDSGVARQITRCEQHIREGKDRAAMVETLLRRSIDLYAAGRLNEALFGFREVLRIDPANSLAREYERKAALSIEATVDQSLSRAQARAGQGDFDAAVDLLKQASVLAPEDPRIDAQLAAIRKRQQEQAASAAAPPAATPQREMVADESVLLPRYREGIQLFEQGRFEAAARELVVVWTAAPGFQDVADTLARAYLFLGMQAYSKGSYDEAIATWERVLSIDPDNAKARRYLNSSREEARRLGAARP